MMNEDRMNRKSKCRIDIVIQFTLTFNGTSSSTAFKLTAIASIPRNEIYASDLSYSQYPQIVADNTHALLMG